MTATASSGLSRGTGPRDQALFIGGAWVDTPQRRPVYDRWTGIEHGSVAIGTADDARAAVDAAELAMASGFPVVARSRVLADVAALLQERAEELAALITAEVGKPITASRLEVSRAVETVRLSAEETRRLPGETVPLDAVAAGEGTFAFTIAQPRGIVAAITPFNFPLNLLLHKVGPAIAAGCAVVVKPSDHAPLVAGLLTALFEQAGLPAGRLNLVTGPPEEIVGAWQADDRVAVVTFTGSSRVGWALKAASPRKTHVLELGSNTAMVVAADADVARAAAAARDAALGNSGQACVSLQRIYVAQEIVEEFVTAVTDLVANSPAGDPRLDSTVVGPLISAEAAERLDHWIASAEAAGARRTTGGSVVDNVLQPTVLVGVPADSPLICEEAFGPVVSVVPYDTLDEALGLLNASDFGLNTAIYTGDLAAAMTFSRQAEAGSVLVNMPPSFRADHMPYGGVKGSGQGREGVKYAIADLLQDKLVVLKAKP